MEYSNDIVEGPSMGMAMATIHDDSLFTTKTSVEYATGGVI